VKLQQFKNFLSSSSRVFQGSEGAVAPDSRGLWEEWVVGRSLCTFRSVDLGNVEKGARDDVLEMMVAQWVPYPRPEYHAEVLGGRSLVWVWDGDKRRAESSRLNALPDRIIPETLVRPQQADFEELDDGTAVDLVTCLDGCEGRAWREGQLVASRWWPEVPSLQDWNRFLLTVDRAPHAAVDAPQEQEVPTSSHWQPSDLLRSLAGSEARQLAVLVAVFALVSAYQLGLIIYGAAASSGLESKIETLNQSVTPILEAREAAYEYQEAANSLARLHNAPLQMEFIVSIQDLLKAAEDQGHELSLAGWHYQASGDAIITIETASVSASELLSLFESLAWMEEQRVVDDVAPNRLRVEAQLVTDWRFEQDPAAGEA